MNAHFSGKTVILTFALFAGLVLPLNARAQCDLKIIAAYTCDGNGKAYTPKVGEAYFIRVNWTVTGTPAKSYKVRFAVANKKSDWSGLPTSSGSYWGYWGWNLPLDGQIPFTITLDPGHVTGDTDTTNNVFNGKFTPVPPATPIEFYDPQTMDGSETFTVAWNNGGTVDHGFTLEGCPVSDSFQEVLAANGPAGSKRVETQPTKDPVWKTDRNNYSPVAGNNQWIDTQNFTVKCSSSRVNMTSLQGVTWANLASLPADYAAWTQPDKMVQSNDPAIANFVNTLIPPANLAKMKPYDAALKLYCAIVKRTRYVAPAPYFDAVRVLNGQQGDCGGFSNLLCACLRRIGIPARTPCGWWKGQNQWHAMAEFYLPGGGWVVADGSQSKFWDPTGKYAYCFGAHTYLNQFCAVTRGSNHQTADFKVEAVQTGYFFYWNTNAPASHSGVSFSCSLK
ncbi:MAG: transglutaminase domain-containing protein [Fimbriimonas ginsengisoli]|nr:transglutaminase domain-containing protein [Fimbriimonas ginsengisoli]